MVATRNSTPAKAARGAGADKENIGTPRAMKTPGSIRKAKTTPAKSAYVPPSRRSPRAGSALAPAAAAPAKRSYQGVGAYRRTLPIVHRLALALWTPTDRHNAAPLAL
jgi:hypothetical protein